VTVLVMQEDECPTSQNGRQPPHQSSWDQRLAVHRLAMSIDVVGGRLVEVPLCWRMPKLCRPSGKRIAQEFSLICLGHQGEQPLRVEVAVGPFPGSRAGRVHRRCSRANPRSDGVRRPQETAASAPASEGKRKSGGLSASPPHQDTKTRLLPAWKVGRFPARLLPGAVHLPPLESSVPLTSREIAVFFPVRSTAAHAQLGPHPIEMSNAD
jgi:hypothetical protein